MSGIGGFLQDGRDESDEQRYQKSAVERPEVAEKLTF